MTGSQDNLEGFKWSSGEVLNKKDQDVLFNKTILPEVHIVSIKMAKNHDIVQLSSWSRWNEICGDIA